MAQSIQPAPPDELTGGNLRFQPWQQRVVLHWPEFAAEFVGTAFLLLCVLTAVSWMFGTTSPLPRLMPSIGLRLLITGLLLGTAGGLVAITPLGRLSGAHLNPALSLAFTILGKMRPPDLAGYVLAQCSGAILGAWVGSLVWRHMAPTVHDAVNLPGAGVSLPIALLGEVVATFLLVAAILVLVSHHATMRWTPLIVAFVVMVLVWGDGNVSGAGMNPARSLGPAVVAQLWTPYWLYAVGPVTGGALAALVHRLALPYEIKTAKLFHDIRYRSIFSGQADHAANQHVRAQHGQLAGAGLAPRTRVPPVQQ